MAVLRAITLDALPNIGALLGASGSKIIIDKINSQFGGQSFFNSKEDIFRKGRERFIETFNAPIAKIANKLSNLANKLRVPKADIISAMTKDSDFIDVSPKMHMPILLYEPVLNLFKQGRIYGFGYDYDNFINQEDFYGRLILNGRVDDIASAMDADGIVEFVSTFKSSDPNLEFEELDMIEQTRIYIDSVLRNTQKDPTDWDSDRG